MTELLITTTFITSIGAVLSFITLSCFWSIRRSRCVNIECFLCGSKCFLCQRTLMNIEEQDHDRFNTIGGADELSSENNNNTNKRRHSVEF